MVFSSYLFLFLFLPLALASYYLMPRAGRHLALTLLSYLFYGWANPLFMVLMFASTLVDYICGLVMASDGRGWAKVPQPLPQDQPRSRRQHIALTVSICSNLSLLGFFKYFNFATENYDILIAAAGLPDLSLNTAFAVTLPLGISFYTFQSMSYSIDVYRGHAAAMRNFIDFACYVSMFPQLVAGPIIRFSEVADQLRHRRHTVTKFARGAAFLCVGLAKKVLLANPCGKIADTAFDAAAVNMIDAWVGATAYAMQIYFDFSAYSDMAIGLGLMLGFRFPKNFDSPYLAHSITDFWRRWHISLSSWLRDYLYIPLGGNRGSSMRTYVNLATVMVLGGLWHGASWNFVIWGSIHGVALGAERAIGKRSPYAFLPRPLQVAMTFTIVLFSWVFFRAADLPSALRYCGAMLGLGQPHAGAQLLGGVIYQPYYVLSLLLALAIAFFCPQTWNWSRRLGPVKVAVCLLLLWLSIVMLVTQAFNPFIYFIF
jgi:alginate O-acetyltransferase complex protein AlgI